MWNYINKLILAPILILSFLAIPLTSVALVTRTVGEINAGDLNTDSSTVDEVRVSSYVTSNGTGVLQSGIGRIKLSSAGSSNVKMVFYSDVAGTPTTLLATSDQTVVTGTSYSDVSFTFTGGQQITITNGTTYWIGFHSSDPGTPTLQISYNSSGSTIKGNTDTYSDGAQTTFVVDSSNTGQLNLLAYYQDTEVLGSSFPIINPNLYDSGLRLDFDGVDERISTVTPSFRTDTKSGGRTVCFWFELDSLPSSENIRTLFAWSNSDAQGVWNMRIRTDRAAYPWTGTRLEFQTAADTGGGTGTSTLWYSSNQEFATGTVYHLCLVSTGTVWELYVNGASKTITVTNTGTGGNDGDWWGDVAGSGTITFYHGATPTSLNDGKFDDLAYFDDDLTATEILLYYNNGKPIHPRAVGLTDLSGYWKMGEAEDGSVTTIHDVAGSDNWTSTNMEDADFVRTNYY